MFKAPNIKGPRFRKAFKPILTTDLYTRFLKSHPQYTSLTYDQFAKTVKLSSEKMWETTLKERDGIELPMGGTLFVGSVKIRKKHNYNIQASIKANAPIKHRNYETDGYSAKIFYSPRMAKIGGRDRSIWFFKGHRNYKRTLSKVYPTDWKKYIVIAQLYTVVKDYHRHKTRHYYQENIEQVSKTYNEFDLN